MLLRPVHPIHYDLAYFAGWKVVVIVLWLPIAARALARLPADVLTSPRCDVGVFFVAIWGAYLIRSMLLWVLGHDHVLDDQGQRDLRHCTSPPSCCCPAGWCRWRCCRPGRQSSADVLPFNSTFGFPIDALAGDLDDPAAGPRARRPAPLGADRLGRCCAWCGARAVRRYAAVGG